MILFLTLVLLFLMITIGGERGAVSIMALAGNIIILFFSVILMSAGFPALLLILAAGAGVCYNSRIIFLCVAVRILCFIRMEIMSKRELPFWLHCL